MSARDLARRLARTVLPASLLPGARRAAQRAGLIEASPIEEPPFQYPFWQTLRASPSPRPQYQWGTLCAASLARNLGYARISVIEFGVAGGNGLVALEACAREAQRRSGVQIDVYGFDTGTGMTRPQDHRDLPQLWGEGFYAMDEAALRARLTSAQLVLGPVEKTVGGFLERTPAPIGFVSFDMDMYHPTMAAFEIFRRDHGLILPRVTCYFDDLIGFSHGDFSGERLAITDFNRERELRKLSQIYGLRFVLELVQWWTEQMYMLHAFDHPRYNEHDGWNRHRQLPLAAG